MSTDDTNDDEPKHPYETEDSFHPLGEEWENQMREELEETDYDAELGMEMARDAQRLVAGEITEEEFQAEYHEDVEEEFEMDDRPLLNGVQAADHEEIEDESVLESLADVDFEADESSRREMMKKMGAGAAFLGYGAFATYDFQPDENAPANVSGIRPKPPEERDNRWGMVIDLQRCDGCLACVAGCINENGTSTGANWMYVFSYEDEEAEQGNFLVRPCQHCSNAPCAKVCPVRARHVRGDDGLVLTDYETCIGCRYCQVACPYGVNYFQWGDPDVPMEDYPHLEEIPSDMDSVPQNMQGKPATPENVRKLDQDVRDEVLTEEADHTYDNRGRWVDGRPPQGVMGKCTFCPTRQDGHSDRPQGTTACQDACDEQGMSAIHFGDLDDNESRPRRYLDRRAEISESEEHNTIAKWADDEPIDWEEQGSDSDTELGIQYTAAPEAQLSTFRLLEDLGTEPNVVYLGNQPGPEAEQTEPPTPYEVYSGDRNDWGVKVVDERKEHLDYGPSGPPEAEGGE
jgi:Fe-S-cluster-containing dehydrogenase component